MDLSRLELQFKTRIVYLLDVAEESASSVDVIQEAIGCILKQTLINPYLFARCGDI